MASNPWGKVASWADDAESAEQERKIVEPVAPQKKDEDEQAFPSLAEAATVKTKKKKEKGRTVSLSEFTSGNFGNSKGGLLDNDKLTVDEMVMLPKAPRERDETEERGLGGGFRNYGGFRGNREDGGRPRREHGDREQGGFERREREDSGPSRADESSNWGADRKFVPADSRSYREKGDRDRYDDRRRDGDRSGFDRGRADEVSDWGSSKKFVPSEAPRRGGFNEERRSSFGGPSKADEVDNWGAAKKFTPSEPTEQRRNDWSRGRNENAGKWGSGDGPEKPRWGRPSGQSEDWGRGRSSQQEKNASAEGNGTESVQNGTVERKEPSRPKPNPFGAARPREVLLQERGEDWKKIDLKLERRAVDRPESEEEAKLKEEIALLKGKLEGKVSKSESNGVEVEEKEEKPSEGKAVMSFKEKLAESIRKEEEGKELTTEGKLEIKKQVEELETKLAKVTLELDDKVRFASKNEEERVGRSSFRVSGSVPESRDGSAGSHRSDGGGHRQENYGRRRDSVGGRNEGFGSGRENRFGGGRREMEREKWR